MAQIKISAEQVNAAATANTCLVDDDPPVAVPPSPVSLASPAVDRLSPSAWLSSEFSPPVAVSADALVNPELVVNAPPSNDEESVPPVVVPVVVPVVPVEVPGVVLLDRLPVPVDVVPLVVPAEVVPLVVPAVVVVPLVVLLLVVPEVLAAELCSDAVDVVPALALSVTIVAAIFVLFPSV